MLKSESSILSNLAPIPKPQRLRAVSLVRVSTSEQATEGKSGLDRQRKSNAAVIASAGYQLVKTIEMIDVSGTSTFSSPEMLNLVSMAEAKAFDCLVVSEISRVIRPNDLTSIGYLDVFKRNGVILNIGGTLHDLSEPEGFLSSGIMSILGGYERMSLIRKMLASKEVSRANGFCPGNHLTLPLGLHFDRTRRKYHYGPEIWKVQLAFELFDQGERNLSEVARRVSIHHRTLKNLLSNTYVIGIRSYLTVRDQTRKTVKAGGRQGDRPKIPRAPEKIIRVRIIPAEEQAVSDERFERVQLVLREMADRHARYVAPSKGLSVLSGIGRCGSCGKILYSATSSRRIDGEKVRGHYLCKSHHYQFKHLPKCSQGWMRRDRMDELVSAFVLQFLGDTEFISGILNNARSQSETIVGIDSLPASIRQQISEIERRDSRILDAVEADLLSISEAKQRRQRLEEEKRALLHTLKITEERNPDSSMPQGVIGRIASMGGVKAWQSLKCPRERKALLCTLFMEIYVKGESITAFRLAPSLVGADSGDWSFVGDIPVTLPEPFRVIPPPEVVVVPDGHKQCSRCKSVLPVTAFYPRLAACRPCINADNNARYAAKVAATKALKQQG